MLPQAYHDAAPTVPPSPTHDHHAVAATLSGSKRRRLFDRQDDGQTAGLVRSTKKEILMRPRSTAIRRPPRSRPARHVLSWLLLVPALVLGLASCLGEPAGDPEKAPV